MKLLSSLLLFAVALAAPAFAQTAKITETKDSIILGRSTDKLGFFGTTAVVQPSSANQLALTDSTGGSVSNATLADGLTATAPSALTATAPAAATAATLTGTLTGTVDGAMVDVAAIALSTSDMYSDAAVNSAVNTAITAVNLQNKEMQTQVNALVADNADLRTKLAAAVVDLAALRTVLAALVTDDSTQNDNDAKLAELANALRLILVNTGLGKGSS